MKPLTHLVAVATLVVPVSLTAFQSAAGAGAPQLREVPATPMVRWARVGRGGVEVKAGVLTLEGRDAVIRGPEFYSDFLLSFEFRTETASDAHVWVRAAIDDGGPGTAVGYRIGLSGDEVGQVALVRAVGVVESARRVLPATEPHWQTMEVRAEGDTLTVSVDGRVTSRVREVEDFTGDIGFMAIRGVLEVRIPVVGSVPHAGMQMKEAEEAGAPLTTPEIVRRVNPAYPAAAKRGGIEGVVLLEGVVLTNGRIGEMKVVRGVRTDLDHAALVAARRWTFKPATRETVAVPVIIRIEMGFTLGG